MGPALISQRYYYLNAILKPKKKSSINNTVFKIHGYINWSKVEKALNKVILTHDSLRTTYNLNNRDVCDSVNETGICRITHIKIQEGSLKDFLQENSDFFDLKISPLIRVYRVEKRSDQYIVLQLPHINSDAWSLEMIIQHLCQYYKWDSLSHHISQFQNYKEAYQKYFDSKKFENDKEFWNKKIEELTSVNYEINNNVSKPSICSIKLPEKLYQDIMRFCSDGQYSIFQFMIFTSLLLLFTLRNSKKSQLMFSVHNRTFQIFTPHENFEETVGLIVNRLILSEDINVDDSVDIFFQRCKANLMIIMKHHKYPFEYFRESVTYSLRKMITPFYFNYFEYKEIFELEQGIYFERENIYKSEEGLPLCIEIAKIGNSIRTLIASNGKYSEETCIILSTCFHKMLEQICLNRNIRIEALFNNNLSNEGIATNEV